jgi:hypothetical protein
VKNIDTAKIDQDTWNRYLMVGFVSTTILWNASSNQALRQSYNTLRSELVQPSASTLNNICWKESPLTEHAITKKLPRRNKVSLGLDRWTSMNNLTIKSVFTKYMDQHWALLEVQLIFHKIDSQSF